MQYKKTSVLMEAAEVDQALSRLADEILDRDTPEELALVGIRTRGVPLARRLAARIQERSGTDVPVGVLDITLYRDDLTTIASQPVVRDTVGQSLGQVVAAHQAVGKGVAVAPRHRLLHGQVSFGDRRRESVVEVRGE